ncbi:hypothetical protein K493DRAFT_336842 [Basidiobolus meristosporus CBS 931.73]|uniref:BZIP domain-containing protein n=1 Tax=Basidiobolus meristosporus CBS 931.73 TaxID=1314790 RepID=A0A1Y1YFY0_9FUNG|nr:hypothetical protein K493DRAFT_336842 [Basidiobolus meristosporus CBS 931.73]|eukprot:ORX96626.1 hypothetical protein K493DRAFT_336842 [Basidiobolus meristosporus CBS 931.73]
MNHDLMHQRALSGGHDYHQFHVHDGQSRNSLHLWSSVVESCLGPDPTSFGAVNEFPVNCTLATNVLREDSTLMSNSHLSNFVYSLNPQTHLPYSPDVAPTPATTGVASHALHTPKSYWGAHNYAPILPNGDPYTNLPVMSPVVPRRRRGSSRETSMTPSMSNPELSARLESDEDKRKRNTAASARFRIKKKLREQALEQTAKDMSTKANMLERKVKELEKEIKWLQSLLIDRDPHFMDHQSPFRKRPSEGVTATAP